MSWTVGAAVPITCFKAYDVRGRLGHDLDEAIAYRIGRAAAEMLNARQIVLGRDCRLSSAPLAGAVAAGLMDAGATVYDLGLSGTEEVYFATAHLGACGGIMITASHNPAEYNGMKLVGPGSTPLAPETLQDIRRVAEGAVFRPAPTPGTRYPAGNIRAAYVARIVSFVDLKSLKPIHILVNAGNGAAGPTFDAIAAALAHQGAPFSFTRLNHTPDGSFPNDVPNPLLPENQPATSRAVVAARADFGVAWDGDFDRCFLFDHQGHFVPGEYVVGLLAQVFLAKEPGATIVHDPRVEWNTRSVIAAHGGRAHRARTGHVFFKQALRETGAVYGGEMSAHHYFRDFMACESGMIPWLLVAELIGKTGQSLAELVAGARAAFPSSGEINFPVEDAAAAVGRVEAALAGQAETVDRLDGLSLTFADWRLNLRVSNTEPLLRLNIETRGDPDGVAAKVAEVTRLISGG